MAESRNLVVINDGMVPTFPRGSSFLDLTLATPDIVQKIGSWEVLETESLSDHQYILYTLTSPKRTTRAARNGWAWRKLDIEKLDSFIANVRVPSTDDAKTSSVECNELLKGACDSCMPNRKYKWGKSLATGGHPRSQTSGRNACTKEEGSAKPDNAVSAVSKS